MENITSTNNDIYKLQLHEEQLDINKKVHQDENFVIYKETYLKEKTIIVPVTHEDIVIKKKNPDTIDSSSLDFIETFRIPISEERIEITKHSVKLEDVKIYKHKFNEVHHIEEVLKKEDLNITTIGDVKIIDND